MPKLKRYEKRKPQPKLEPRRTSYSIGDRDVWGIEFDARFKDETVYSRLFFIPAADHLYRWMIDRRPERFVQIPITSISQKRKAALLKVWNAVATEEKTTA
jgi:hypothetical protein